MFFWVRRTLAAGHRLPIPDWEKPSACEAVSYISLECFKAAKEWGKHRQENVALMTLAMSVLCFSKFVLFWFLLFTYVSSVEHRFHSCAIVLLNLFSVYF